MRRWRASRQQHAPAPPEPAPVAGSDPGPTAGPQSRRSLEPDPVALAQARVEHATLQVAAAHSARSARQDELARSRAACLGDHALRCHPGGRGAGGEVGGSCPPTPAVQISSEEAGSR